MLQLSQYRIGCDYRNLAPMLEIDAKWIKERLTGERGEKAALARALNIEPEKVSRILSGDRQIKAGEVPLIRQFFASAGLSPNDQLRLLVDQLTPEEARTLLGAGRGMFAHHFPEEGE